MRALHQRGAILILVLGLCGCAATTQQSVRTGSKTLAARPDAAPIDIYLAEQKVDHPFEEVGMVSAQKRAATAFNTVQLADLVPMLQAQARALGADAVIIRETSEFKGASLTGSMTIPAASATGIAIRYLKPDPSPPLVLPRDLQPRSATPLSVRAVTAIAAPSVVQIETDNAQGSGFVVLASGLILTNYDVVRGSTAIIVKTADGRRSGAVVQASDTMVGVVLLKVSLDSLVPLRMGSITTVVPGQRVFGIGSALSHPQTLSRGVVASVSTSEVIRVVQTTVTVGALDRGGPLLNDRAEVIGVVRARAVRAVPQGRYAAVAIDDVLVALGINRPR